MQKNIGWEKVIFPSTKNMRNDGSCCMRETESISVPGALLHINVGELQVKCFT